MNFVLAVGVEGFFFCWVMGCIVKVTRLASGPMFERSGYLIIFSNVLNLLEVILNLAIGFSFYVSPSDLAMKILINLIIYTCRLYAACTFLRMLRIIILYKFRKGEISRSLFLKLSSFKFIYFLCFIYAGLVQFMIILIVFKYHLSSEILPYINNTIYIIEASSFFLLSVIILKYNIYPSLFVEYLIYSLLWFISGLQFRLEFNDRWLLEIPVRNNILVLISWISIKIDHENQRPPLPAELGLDEVFQIEELYYDFYEYVKRYSDDCQVYACHALKELAKGSFYENYEGINLRGTELKDRFDPSFRDLLEESMYDDLKVCIRDNLKSVFEEYCNSQEFSRFKRSYFIDFDYKDLILNIFSTKFFKFVRIGSSFVGRFRLDYRDLNFSQIYKPIMPKTKNLLSLKPS